jgi:hypothetical protein
VIRLIVLQQLFSSEHLQNYIAKKIRQFSSHVRVTESITNALDSEETQLLINQRLELVFAEPDAQFLEALGISRHDIQDMIRPAVLSLCAETAPYVLENIQQSQLDRPKVRVHGRVAVSMFTIMLFVTGLECSEISQGNRHVSHLEN